MILMAGKSCRPWFFLIYCCSVLMALPVLSHPYCSSFIPGSNHQLFISALSNIFPAWLFTRNLMTTAGEISLSIAGR
ncbi:hypothetical protein A7K99_03650 [Tatumella citrea]|uniref:Uncharacterized protein n=1 Tax=Tatumella citrea TaxID=53336 RepID=A0A1Y0L4M7_TATCI|nr:hypothetical protein A7K98_03650 [Tatumella citrea]ARU97010.1 hypothetical protein A7K99_03650 [Tatumella citrea]